MNNTNLDSLLVTDDIRNIYLNESIPFQQIRYDNFISLFTKLFKEKPHFVARAPGRVNLIGEHIDYAGYAVLPMAIENDALIAFNFSRGESPANNLKISVKHENQLLEEKEFNIDLTNNSNLKLNFSKEHSWVNYFIAGYNCILEYLMVNNQALESSLLRTTNINILVTGNVPFASGLSSSSALTVCSAITFLHIFNQTQSISKQELAELTIKYERSVGTACGGMDQTICLFGEKNKAKLIDFNPIRLSSIDLPTSVSFIIANSCTPSAKIDTLAFRYNKRVVENKLGLALIAKNLKLQINKFENLLQLQKELQVSFFQLKEIISTSLTQDKYSEHEVKTILEIDSLDLLLNTVPYYTDVLQKNSEYFLRQRLIHVASEAERVISFAFSCKEDSSLDEIKELGNLMNSSHSSCKNDYDCSSEQLDILVDLLNRNGCYGSRLTGAGWGGCTVTMVDSNKVDHFLEVLKKFYEENHNIKDPLLLKDIFFITKPSQGACIYKLA